MRETQNFNPRSGERSDTNHSCHLCSNLMISIHAPANGATLYDVLIKIRPNISIHAPANGATCTNREPRSKNAISIHAPANGATRYSFSVRTFRKISIHAPANGATCRVKLFLVTVMYFNPRSGERSDHTQSWMELV